MSLGSEKPPQFSRSTLLRYAIVSLICISLLIYAWPIFQGPLLMDEVYGVIGIQGIYPSDSFFSLVKRPFSEELLNYFLAEQGRIVPFGSVLYQTGYWLTTNIAFATGFSIIDVYSFFKIFFLFLSFVGLRKLLIEFAEEGGIKDSQKRIYITNLTLLSAFVFVSGLRTDFADRNGLMVYPFLTYTALLYAVWIPWILIRIRRSFYGTLTFPLASVIFGVVIGFGYELHYCAIITSTIALLITRQNRKNLSKSTLRDLVLITSFGITFLINQMLIKNACANVDCYSGTSIQIGQELPSTFFHNLVGNLPLKANSTFELYSKLYSKKVVTFDVPSMLSVGTVLPTLLISILMLGLLYRHNLLNLGNTNTAVLEYRAIAKKGLVTFMGLGAFVVITTSLSQFSQELLTNSVPYRGYVVTWFSISVSLTLLIFSATNRLKMPTVASIILGLIIGCYLHAWSSFGVDVVTALGKNAKFQVVISDFQKKPGIGNDDTKRCTDLEALGNSRTAIVIRMEIDAVYKHFHGEKFCSTNIVLADPTDQFINR